MNPERNEHSLETLHTHVLTPSLVSQLSQNTLKDSFLPYELKQNPDLTTQCKERQRVSQLAGEMFGLIPEATMSIKEALDEGLVDVEAVSEFYGAMSKLLQKKENRRLALYFPFELLPASDIQMDEARDFSSTYLSAWYNLLHEKNIRADFYDGDVPEQHLRSGQPLPLVVKAAHLVPTMIEKGILTLKEVLEIIEKEDDDVTLSSLMDSLRVLSDLGLLTDEDISTLQSSRHFMVQNMAELIKSDRLSPPQSPEIITVSLEELVEVLTAKLQEINNKVERENLPEARTSWLRDSLTKKATKESAYSIALLFKNKTTQLEVVENFIHGTASPSAKNAISDALSLWLLDEAKKDKVLAVTEFQRYKHVIMSAEPEQFKRSLLQLYSAGIVTKEELAAHDIEEPQLETSGEQVSPEYKDTMEKFVSEIEKNKELSSMVYPVVISLGSRMKGYAQKNSDTDLGIFIKPNTPLDDRVKIQDFLHTIHKEQGVRGSVMEFWLKEEGDTLWIRDFINPDSALGDSSLSHPLLGSWFGNQEAIRELQQKIIPNYLYSKNKMVAEEDAQTVWLEDMEHTILQYRLMHKGYENLFASQGGIHTTHADEIDGASIFYDSGYRRLATKLFIDRVFIPQIEKKSQ